MRAVYCKLMEISARTLEETREVAEQAIAVLRSAAWHQDRAVVLGLSGALGAGKTAFVQCVAAVLGVAESVTSPTFVLRSDYRTTDTVFNHFVHIDAYRLEDAGEVATIGWDAVLAMPYTLVAVEWVDRIKEYVPADTFFITIAVRGAVRLFSSSLFTSSV